MVRAAAAAVEGPEAVVGSGRRQHLFMEGAMEAARSVRQAREAVAIGRSTWGRTPPCLVLLVVCFVPTTNSIRWLIESGSFACYFGPCWWMDSLFPPNFKFFANKVTCIVCANVLCPRRDRSIFVLCFAVPC